MSIIMKEVKISGKKNSTKKSKKYVFLNVFIRCVIGLNHTVDSQDCSKKSIHTHPVNRQYSFFTSKIKLKI